MITFATILSELLPALNAASMADLSFWTEETLYEYAAEASRELGRTGVFIDRQSVDIVSGSSGYALPAATLFVVHTSLDGHSLRPINVQELDALDSNWRATAGAVTHWAGDVSGFESFALYRTPEDDGIVWLIRHTYPVPTGPASTHPGSEVFGDAIRYRILESARATDSDGMMPDVAKHSKGMADLYSAICGKYWVEAE